MIDIEAYRALKKRADAAKESSAKAAGAYEQSMKTLKERFECNTIEEAEALLATMRAELVEAESEYSRLLTEFEAKWGKLI